MQRTLPPSPTSPWNRGDTRPESEPERGRGRGRGRSRRRNRSDRNMQTKLKNISQDCNPDEPNQGQSKDTGTRSTVRDGGIIDRNGYKVFSIHDIDCGVDALTIRDGCKKPPVSNQDDRTDSSPTRNVSVTDLRFISKLDHGDTSGNNLKNAVAQENVYGLIRDKLNGLPQEPKRSDFADSLILFRKLREALTSTRRIDTFSIKVYEHAASTALEADDMSEFHVCLVTLANTLYPNVVQTLTNDQERTNLRTQWVNTLAELITYCGCYLGEPSQVLLIIREISPLYMKEQPIRMSIQAVQAVDNYNFSRFFSILPQTTGRRNILMQKSFDEVRKKAVAVYRRAYMSLELNYITDSLMLPSKSICSSWLVEHSAITWTDIKDEIVNFRPRI
eukprot:CFRG3560T1